MIISMTRGDSFLIAYCFLLFVCFSLVWFLSHTRQHSEVTPGSALLAGSGDIWNAWDQTGVCKANKCLTTVLSLRPLLNCLFDNSLLRS